MSPANPLRILHTESSLNWGGQEYRTLDEVRWLRERGHVAWIACDPESELMKRAGAEFCVPVPMAGAMDWRATRVIRRFCREQKIQVIHTHSSTDSWVCYPLHLAEWPVVRSRQVTNLVRPSVDRAFIYRHGCARVVASAECIRRNLVEHTRVAAKRVEVIGEGINLSRFRPDVDGRRVRAEWGVEDGVVLFGLVAMIRPEKGHLPFIEAAMDLVRAGMRVRFAIVGEGVGAREFEQDCRRCLIAWQGVAEEGPAFMTGYRSDIPEVMAALDVLVVPSLAEAQSLVVPQAFATGKPVIASRVGGLPELVTQEQTGLLVEPGDVAGLKLAMRRLATDDGLRAELGGRALAFARSTLSFDAKMAACVGLYHEVAAVRARGKKKRVLSRRRVRAGKTRGERRGRSAGGRTGVRMVPVLPVLLALVGLFFAGYAELNRSIPAAHQAAQPAAGVTPEALARDGVDDSNVYESLSPSMFATLDERIIG